MNDQNKSVLEYLDYFINLKQGPGFAVLLKGPWGSGKSWFVKRYMSKQGEDQFLYVSLYGVTSIEEITEQFLSQLHPVVQNKAVKLLRGIGKIALSASVSVSGVDLSTENITDKMSLASWIKLDGKTLIFDDLERSSMPLNEILGYINGLVEHENRHVIIIGNEKEITDENYLKFKEKLIGQSFELFPDIESAFNSFVSEMNEGHQKIFQHHKNLILEVFLISEKKNLRLLKQGLMDFERIFLSLGDPFTSNDEFMRNILKIFFSFSLEIKSGDLKSSEILKGAVDGIMISTAGSKKDDKSKLQTFLSRYFAGKGFINLVFPSEVWTKIFDDGVFDSSKLKTLMKETSFFQDDSGPIWRALWDFRYLGDESFTHLMGIAKQRFEKREYENWGEVLHLIGLFLRFQNWGLVEWDEKEIEKRGLLAIDGAFSKGFLAPDIFKNDDFESRDEFWGGAQFHSCGNPVFIKVRDHIFKKAKEARINYAKDFAKNIGNLLQNDLSTFVKKITDRKGDGTTFHDIPVFEYVDLKNFSDIFYNLEPMNQLAVLKAMDSRYSNIYHPDLDSIRSERTFYDAFKQSLIQKSGALKGKLSSLRYEEFSKSLESVIKIIDTPKSQPAD